MTIKEKLRESLMQLNFDSIRVDIEENSGGFIITVISPSFTPMNNAERQRIVWKQLLDHFPTEQLTDIEFIFTIDDYPPQSFCFSR